MVLTQQEVAVERIEIQRRTFADKLMDVRTIADSRLAQDDVGTPGLDTLCSRSTCWNLLTDTSIRYGIVTRIGGVCLAGRGSLSGCYRCTNHLSIDCSLITTIEIIRYEIDSGKMISTQIISA